MVNNNVQN